MRGISSNQRGIADSVMGWAILGVVFLATIALWPKLAKHFGTAAREAGRAKGQFQAGLIEGEAFVRDAKANLGKVTVELKETRK